MPVWLSAIGDAVVELVAARLMEAGILARSKSLLGRRGRFPAINLLAAAGPRVRLVHMVREPQECDVAGATCAALIDAVGAGRVLQGDLSRRELRRGLTGLAATLPADLRSVVTSVEVALKRCRLRCGCTGALPVRAGSASPAGDPPARPPRRGDVPARRRPPAACPPRRGRTRRRARRGSARRGATG